MGAMKPSTLIGTFAALGLGLSGGAALGGCGTQTKTVSVTTPPQVAQTSAKTNSTQTGTATTSTTPSTPTASTPAQTTTNGGASAPATTRTAPEPAFAQQEPKSEGQSAADALVRAKGYTPTDPSQYHANQTLQVLVGKRSASTNGLGQQAFFFVDGRFIGTDTKEASAAVKLISQSDTEVTLGYPLYRQGDPPSAPSGGQSVVHYQLNNGKLTPVGKAP